MKDIKKEKIANNYRPITCLPLMEYLLKCMITIEFLIAKRTERLQKGNEMGEDET